MEKQLLNTDAALEMLSGENDLYKMLIDAFLAESPENLEMIEQLVSEERFEDARAVSHKIKGTASQLGAEHLTFALQYLEDTLKGRMTGDPILLCKNANLVFVETIKFIKDYRSTL